MGRSPWVAAAVLAAVAHPAAAQELKPLVDARLRHEFVDQDGFARDANAVTARVRAGVEAGTGDFALLAESEATFAIHEGSNSGLNGRTRFPLVPDPENVELNRLQLTYRGLPKTVLTAGRQRIALDDQRFVGNVGWRQNEQTFDAVRLEWAGVKGVKADLSYVWSVRTIWGIDGAGARPTAIGGDNLFATLAYATPVGTLTGFAFAVDQDEAAVNAFQLASQSYGVRLAGARPLSKAAKLSYALSYARQSDLGRNPNDYLASYYLADFALDAAGLRFGLGYEELGAAKAGAFTSFQTPLATLHKFQGWADKFLITPPNGIRDLYASLGYARKLGSLGPVSVQAVYHRFNSDRLDQRYGDELDLLASMKRGRYTLTAKYAGYDAGMFATDTDKAWLQLDWAY